MQSPDKYALFLRLTASKQQGSSSKIPNNSSQKLHPSYLSGKRNPNSESYKKLCQSSDIFKEVHTPVKVESKRTNEASQRKLQEDLNSVRTICPSDDRVQATPNRNPSRENIRYNPNAESIQKDSRRVLKSCTQRDQDFTHRINLPISAMQIKDFKEDNYGLGRYRGHEKSQQMKHFYDFQSQLSNVENFTTHTERMKRKKIYSETNLLTSYQLCKSAQKCSKKQFEQGKQLQQVSNIAEVKIFKPQNKVFLQSEEEVWDLQKYPQKRKMGTIHVDVFKSSLKLL